jgi:hypothetical protein
MDSGHAVPVGEARTDNQHSAPARNFDDHSHLTSSKKPGREAYEGRRVLGGLADSPLSHAWSSEEVPSASSFADSDSAHAAVPLPQVNPRRFHQSLRKSADGGGLSNSSRHPSSSEQSEDFSTWLDGGYGVRRPRLSSSDGRYSHQKSGRYSQQKPFLQAVGSRSAQYMREVSKCSASMSIRGCRSAY